MRARSLILGAAALVLAPLFSPLCVHADVIRTFVSTVHIKTDASADVTEDINYDFGEAQHHGIYRDIPVVYKDDAGALRRISITDVAVTDGKLSPYLFTVEDEGDAIRIKIGDPSKFVTGLKDYQISYTAHDVVGFFSDHDELYWNATGNDWTVPMLASGARVYAPASSTQSACYIGFAGSTDKCATVADLGGATHALFFVSGRPLAPGEGLTVAVGFPRGYVQRPPLLQRIWNTARRFLVFLVPLAALAVLVVRWWRHGRDAKGRGTIVPEYEAPAGFTPAVISELIHERVTTGSISAIIIELAVRSYLTISREVSETLGIFESVSYRFARTKPADDQLAPDERVVYDALFSDGDSISSAELKTSGSLVSARTAVQKIVGEKMVSDGYYASDPTTVRTVHVILGAAVALFGFFLANAAHSAFTALAMLITGALIAVFGFLMPARTQRGAIAREQILGLKEYLQIAEKNRLDFHNAPEKSPELFEKLLPAAIVLGVSAAWAKEFDGIYKEPPSWYNGASYAAFSPASFETDMASLSTAVASAATPTSHGGGSGGGGFSGGGFGGGGGGSW